MKSYLLLILFSFSIAQAEAYRRLVNFEWEPIEEAKSYEIEIRKKGSTKKTNSFKSEKPEWNGRLPVGKYEFRLRSLDVRKVPGDWSAFAELDVNLEPVKPKFPLAQSMLPSTKENESTVKFEWQAVPVATSYQIVVINDKGEVLFDETTKDLKKEFNLKSAKKYSYRVKALSDDKEVSGDFSMPIDFTIVGSELKKVEIEKPDSEFIRELKWQKAENAENYDVVLARFNPQTQKWQKFKEYENYDSLSLNFESDWPGGKYRLMVKSKANIREPSKLSTLSFDVRTGDRSPAAEYINTMRKSIERENGWFSHISWYASSISLDSKYKNAIGFKTNSITGTGRFGAGWLEPKSKWGFLAIADVGGFIFENSVYNFVGLEFSAIRKQELTDRSDVRYHMGVFVKEFPALWTTSSSATTNFLDKNNTERKYGKGGVLGPHVGAEYWYSLTPKIGMQANLHFYLPVSGIEFPNGGKITGSEPNISIGALGSYRYSSRLTGLIGVNYKMESYSYTDPSDSAGWQSSPYAFDVNESVKTILDGIYINLMAEYTF